MGHKPPVVRTILVVEDDEALRRMLTVSLGRLGDVVAASSADEALARILAGVRPSVIVTDWMMPGTSGIELLRTVRKDPTLHDVPVVVLTAKTGPRDVVDGINAGARHYVTKPFKSADLEKKIARLLEHAPIPAPPPPPAAELEELDSTLLEELDDIELEVVVD